ncbi:mitochondrial fission protein ELM1-like isoform X2 [Phragmites australis]|uniref:mitochondrial fission protein ELM1-like isoform X2 n=1 Tax=Phragmites australis TaxID=29695 RepID=UPI002D785BC5|nr:mitochondrial fission protein ELM1-like isoform X2 [Phragmites australis]
MRPIRLPEPPSGGMETPEIFAGGGGGANVVRRAVLIDNGSPGSKNQCLGLARALGLADNLTLYRVTRPRGGINEWLHFLPISLHKFIDEVLRQFFRNTRFAPVVQGRKPFRVPNGGSVGLSSVLEADVKRIVVVARDTFEKEGPTLVVACGRDTISYSSLIRKLASDNVFVIQHPRSHLDRFDLVVTPRHDYYALTASGQQEVPRLFRRWITPQEPPGRNVVLTVGALHQADSAALRLAAIAWHDELAPLPKPLLIVNIGGPTRNCKYGVDLSRQLITSLYNVLDSCGSVRISFSMRTPQKVSDIIFKEFDGHPKIYIWDGEEPNPHMGHLAWADAFVITADSISMLSEACSTGKPVYVIGTEHCKWKFSAFHKALRERGVVRPFTGLEDISNSWSYPPLNDAIEVATRAREVIAERGWTVG